MNVSAQRFNNAYMHKYVCTHVYIHGYMTVHSTGKGEINRKVRMPVLICTFMINATRPATTTTTAPLDTRQGAIHRDILVPDDDLLALRCYYCAESCATAMLIYMDVCMYILRTHFANACIQ